MLQSCSVIFDSPAINDRLSILVVRFLDWANLPSNPVFRKAPRHEVSQSIIYAFVEKKSRMVCPLTTQDFWISTQIRTLKIKKNRNQKLPSMIHRGLPSSASVGINCDLYFCVNGKVFSVVKGCKVGCHSEGFLGYAPFNDTNLPDGTVCDDTDQQSVCLSGECKVTMLKHVS